jgi:hypothetical protein
MESIFDMLGVAKKLVKYVVNLFKKKILKISLFLSLYGAQTTKNPF